MVVVESDNPIRLWSFSHDLYGSYTKRRKILSRPKCHAVGMFSKSVLKFFAPIAVFIIVYFLPYFKNATLPGLGTSSSLKISTICLGLIPEALHLEYSHDDKARFLGYDERLLRPCISDTHTELSSRLYLPSIACVLYRPVFFSTAYSPRAIVENLHMGIISTALLSRFAVSTLSCMATLRPNPERRDT